MSQLQVTTITTINNTTPLILQTGNTGGGQIILQASNNDVQFVGPLRLTANVVGDGSGLTIPSSNVANAAFGIANGAFGFANGVSANTTAAFAKANAALANASGTFAGNLSVTGNVGIGTNFSSKFFEIRKDQNSETSLWITNNNSIAPGTNNSIIFGGYRDIDSVYQVAKISAIHGTGSSANANHSGALAFFTQQAVGISNPELPVERMRIDSAGRVTMPNQPCFFAWFPTNPNLTSGNIIYTLTITNVGGHYNTTNGRFTAPVAGNYYFVQTTFGDVSTSTNSYFHIRFLKNGASIGPITHSQYNDTRAYETITSSMCVYLNVNDYINVFFDGASGGREYTGSYTNLSGFLIG